MEEPEATTPDPYVEKLPPGLVMHARYLLMVGAAVAQALRHPRPALRPVLAEMADLLDLTEADDEALAECAKSAAATAKELFLRPARLYQFVARGVAVYESPLAGSPLLPPLPEPHTAAHLRRFADTLFGMLESNKSGELVNFPLPFDPLAPGGIWTPEGAAAAQAAKTPKEKAADEGKEPDPDELVGVYPIEDLRLTRLRLDSLLATADALLTAAAEADRTEFGPAGSAPPDPADDPARADFYHKPLLALEVSPALQILVRTSLVIGVAWLVYDAVPFAYAASRLRWLQRHDTLLALQQTFAELTYHDPEDLTESVEVELSLAELLTLYQAMESLALAALTDDILPAVRAEELRQRAAAQAAGELDDDAPTDGGPADTIGFIQMHLAAGRNIGTLFFRNVPVLAQLLADNLTGDEATEFAAARAEVAALAELATSAGAV